MKNKGFIDISFPYYEGMAIYPNNPRYVCRKVSNLKDGDLCSISEITFGTHTGTHLDAPSHFIRDGMTIDQLPLERINGKAKLFHIKKPVITDSDLEQYEIEKDDIVIFKTSNSETFEGKNILDSYVTLDYNAAQCLADKKVKMVGIDYMTIERPKALREPGRSVHQILLGNGIYILEALDLREVGEDEYVSLCLPLKLNDCDGSPVRAVLVR